MFDVVIIGTGPAGLSAALVLARCRRRLLICDSGKPRNAVSRSLNGFITRDGIHPAEFRRLAREETMRYPGAEFRDIEVTHARRVDGHFAVELADGSHARGRTLLLATGRVDVVPPVEGMRELYGHGVYQCPYCDGWEHRDQPIAVYGRGTRGLEFALELLAWSHDVVLCSDGPAQLTPEQLARLQRHRVPLDTRRVRRLEIDERATLAAVCFEDGTRLPRTALFFLPDQEQRSPLPQDLGCEFDDEGSVICQRHVATNIPGLYVAGNATSGLQLAIIAAAEGTAAAFEINNALADIDCR